MITGIRKILEILNLSKKTAVQTEGFLESLFLIQNQRIGSLANFLAVQFPGQKFDFEILPESGI